MHAQGRSELAMNVSALGTLPSPFASSAGDTRPHRSLLGRRQPTPLHAQPNTAYAQRDVNTPGAAGETKIGMPASGKRIAGLSDMHDRRKRDVAGFLDSRDLDGRPGDEYGLDWLRQQGLSPLTSTPPPPPPRVMHLAITSAAVRCLPALLSVQPIACRRLIWRLCGRG